MKRVVKGGCQECGRKATYFVVAYEGGQAKVVDLCGYHQFPGGLRKNLLAAARAEGLVPGGAG